MIRKRNFVCSALGKISCLGNANRADKARSFAAVAFFVLNFFASGAMANPGVGVQKAEELPQFDCVIEPSEMADLGSALPGVVGKIYVNRNDMVKKGEVVAELESSVERANLALSEARATLNTSIKLREESAAFGRRTRERNQTLYKNSSISQQELDKLETENRIAQLQVVQERDNKRIAVMEYERAKAVLERHMIRSPFDGVVMERFKAVGEFMEDDAVVRVAQLNPLHVEAILPVEYMGSLQPGRKATVRPGLIGVESQVATVTRVDRVADAASGTFGVRLALPNPDYSVPAGLRCSLAFLSPEESLDNLEAAGQPVLPAEIVENHLEQAVLEPVGVKPIGVEQAEVDQVIEEEVLVESPTASSPVDSQLINEGVIHQQETANPAEAVQEIAMATDSQKAFEQILRDVSANSNCFRVGPMANAAMATEFSNVVAATYPVHQPQIDLAESGNTRYQVFVAAPEGMDKRKALVAALKAKGLKDIHLVYKGDFKGRISAGYFKAERHALERKKQLDDLGIDSELVAMGQNKGGYWVNLLLEKQETSYSDIQILANNLMPDVSVQQAQCDQLQLTRRY